MDKLKLSPKRDTIKISDLVQWTYHQADEVKKLTSSGVYDLT